MLVNKWSATKLILVIVCIFLLSIVAMYFCKIGYERVSTHRKVVEAVTIYIDDTMWKIKTLKGIWEKYYVQVNDKKFGPFSKEECDKLVTDKISSLVDKRKAQSRFLSNDLPFIHISNDLPFINIIDDITYLYYL